MKIICVGRNYARHAEELQNTIPEEPVIFLKPETALLPKGHPFFYPEFSNNVHYEAELVLRINRLGKHISEKHARKYYSEIGIGIDFTARDIQQKLKEKGLPWEKAKAFDHSAPISRKLLKISDLPDPANISFHLNKNGQTVQRGKSSYMLFSFDQIIAYVSTFLTLKIGDLIFTGTPAGVGSIKIGDELEAFVENQSMMKLKVR